MFAEERYSAITEMIQKKGTIKVSELMELFAVSIETIRRDLVFLETQGVLKRVYGGAVVEIQKKTFDSLPKRLTENTEEKRQIATLAMSFIQENDIISIDSGSTAIELVKGIKNKFKELTIVTHSLDVFNALSDSEGYQLVLIGGQFLRSEAAFYGGMALDTLQKIHVNKCFVFPSAISSEYGIEDYNIELIPIQRMYLAISDQCFVLADCSKFEVRGFLQIAPINDRHIYLTDSKLDEAIYTSYSQKGMTLFRGE